MSKHETYLLILGMALVTYLPRAIPVFLAEKFTATGRIKKFFSLLPYHSSFAGNEKMSAGHLRIGGGCCKLHTLLSLNH